MSTENNSGLNLNLDYTPLPEQEMVPVSCCDVKEETTVSAVTCPKKPCGEVICRNCTHYCKFR